MVNGKSDALALEGYSLALMVDCLNISLDLGMVVLLSCYHFIQVKYFLC
jgi:hypothetical protein